MRRYAKGFAAMTASLRASNTGGGGGDGGQADGRRLPPVKNISEVGGITDYEHACLTSRYIINPRLLTN